MLVCTVFNFEEKTRVVVSPCFESICKAKLITSGLRLIWPFGLIYNLLTWEWHQSYDLTLDKKDNFSQNAIIPIVFIYFIFFSFEQLATILYKTL